MVFRKVRKFYEGLENAPTNRKELFNLFKKSSNGKVKHRKYSKFLLKKLLKGKKYLVKAPKKDIPKRKAQKRLLFLKPLQMFLQV